MGIGIGIDYSGSLHSTTKVYSYRVNGGANRGVGIRANSRSASRSNVSVASGVSNS